MPSTYITNLVTRRDTIAAQLAALTSAAGTVGSKPNLSHTDGGTAIDHERYKEGLYKELREINQQIEDAMRIEAMLDDDDDGPFEHVTVMGS